MNSLGKLDSEGVQQLSSYEPGQQLDGPLGAPYMLYIVYLSIMNQIIYVCVCMYNNLKNQRYNKIYEYTVYVLDFLLPCYSCPKI